MKRRPFGWALAVTLCALGARLGAAQADQWGSQTFPDPLRFSSLPLDAAQAVAPPDGRWQVSDSLGYFNVWQLTWHTGTIHRALGLLGQPLTPEEIGKLERDFPHDQFYHIDVEGWRDDLTVTRGLGDGWAATVQVPWIAIGAPRWDAIAEDFHNRLGLSNMRRDWFPRGQTVVYVRGRNGAVERWSELATSGLGDVSLAVTGPLGSWLGGDHRWVAAVQAPTGERNTLQGSGGWDVGLRWFGTWGRERRQVRLGLGYTWLDPSGSWLGVKRDNTWHALLEGHSPLGQRLTLRASLRFDSSPIAGFTDSDIGSTSSYWMLGVLGPLPGGGWWAFDAGENYPSKAEVPDFSFHLLFGSRF